MKRLAVGFTLGLASSAALLLPMAHAEDFVPTVGSVTENNGLTRSGHLVVMTPSILRVAPSPAIPPDPQQAIAHYDELLKLTAPPELRAEAMRRSAYLRVWMADVGERGDGPELRKAIALYEQLLRELPNDPGNDLALYQLARAWQLTGEAEPAIAALQKLGRTYPKSELVADAHLRAGELLYARTRYSEAEPEYAAVVAMGPEAQYYAIAQYKYAWTLYQQAKYEQALPVFLAILEQGLPPGAINDTAVLAVVDKKKAEFTSESLRVAGLCFAALGGGKAINQQFAAHGEPRFSTLIYTALGASLMDQRRYSDAAEVYTAFIDRHPDHALAPEFQQRVITAYQQGGFTTPLLQAKETYTQRYFPGAPYWHGQKPAAPVLTALRQHLDDLGHWYQAQAQKLAVDDAARKTTFASAANAYQRLLQLDPEPAQRAQIGMLYADALLDGGQTREAADQYLHVAYDAPNAKSAEAAYAAVQAYQKQAQDAAARPEALRASIAASERLADQFKDHPQWVAALTRAAQDRFELHDDAAALALAQRTLQSGKPISAAQRGELLMVVADARYAQKDYAAAESAYGDLLKQNTLADAPRSTAVEHLATSIYKQAEVARDAGDMHAAAAAFQRVASAAPTASIRSTADYDAAAALISLRDWKPAAAILESFRARNPQHALSGEVDKKLAYVYEQDQQFAAAAGAYSRVAQQSAETVDIRAEAAWQAAQLYDRARMTPAAARAYENYVSGFPQQFDRGLQARRRLADLARDYSRDQDRYQQWLQDIVAVDARAAVQRNDNSKHMAAQASLELGRLDAQHANAMPLREPLASSLLQRKQATEVAIASLLKAAAYGDAQVTTAATYEIGAAYRDFGRALLTSARPAKMEGEVAQQYQILLEEQADPFEQKSIEAHEANLHRIAQGLWDDWIHRSATQLAELAPAVYGKHELREDRYEALPDSLRTRLAVLSMAGLLAACAVGPPTQPDRSPSSSSSAALPAGRDAGKGDPKQRFDAALQMMQEGRRDEAITALQSLGRDYPQFSGPSTDLGIIYAQSHRRPEAIASFAQAVKVNPRNVVAWNWLGMLYRESGDFAHAEQSYRQALAVKPDYAAAYLNLAILYDLSMHRSQDALQQYRNYQQYAGGKASPMVSVWIKEIEMASTTAGGAVVAGAQP